MSRRTQRGGPVPPSGPTVANGARVVAPAVSQATAQRARTLATPGRPARVRLLQERLNVDFFREAWAELRKVHWPSRVQARNLTGLVIGISLAVGIILGGMDYLFARVFAFILGTG